MDRQRLDTVACIEQLERENTDLHERLRLNQERLTQAIRTSPGWANFNGTPESATGVAAQIVELRENTPKQPSAFRVRLEHLRFPPNVPAGLNPLVLFSLAYQMRATLDDPGGPILVQRSGQGGWRVTDGRHRALASMIAGRPDVLARETPS